MTNLNMGLKSALLALTLMVAVPTPTASAQQAPAAPQAVASFLSQHQVGCIFAGVLFVMYTRLKTKNPDKLKSKGLKEDFKKIMDSFNIFDSALYKQLLTMFDDYIVGLPIKFVTVDMPSEDKSYTIKGKKRLIQSPEGALGLFDAYVISQIEDFKENIPALAALYVFITNPELFIGNAIKEAKGEK